jgi:hypothetical protein
VVSGEATHTNLIVIGLTQLGLKPNSQFITPNVLLNVHVLYFLYVNCSHVPKTETDWVQLLNQQQNLHNSEFYKLH